MACGAGRSQPKARDHLIDYQQNAVCVACPPDIGDKTRLTWKSWSGPFNSLNDNAGEVGTIFMDSVNGAGIVVRQHNQLIRSLSGHSDAVCDRPWTRSVEVKVQEVVPTVKASFELGNLFAPGRCPGHPERSQRGFSAT